PLITDMVAAGKTPAQLADDIRAALAQYIQEPLVSVIVNRPQGSFSQQIRIVGAAVRPTALPYRANMTVMDAMIAAGGLSEFAAGDRAKLIRVEPTLPSNENRVGLVRRADVNTLVASDADLPGVVSGLRQRITVTAQPDGGIEISAKSNVPGFSNGQTARTAAATVQGLIDVF